MKTLQMRSFVRMIAGLAIVWLPSAELALAADDPPLTIVINALQEFYEPVVFDHEMHLDGYDCEVCHHHTIGKGTEHPVCKRCHATTLSSEEVGCASCHGVTISATGKKTDTMYHIDKPGLKGALHLQCIGCHRQEGGAVLCQECHELTPAGRHRFHLRTTE